MLWLSGRLLLSHLYLCMVFARFWFSNYAFQSCMLRWTWCLWPVIVHMATHDRSARSWLWDVWDAFSQKQHSRGWCYFVASFLRFWLCYLNVTSSRTGKTWLAVPMLCAQCQGEVISLKVVVFSREWGLLHCFVWLMQTLCAILVPARGMLLFNISPD